MYIVLNMKQAVFKLFKHLLSLFDLLLGDDELSYFKSHSSETHDVVQIDG